MKRLKSTALLAVALIALGTSTALSVAAQNDNMMGSKMSGQMQPGMMKKHGMMKRHRMMRRHRRRMMRKHQMMKKPDMMSTPGMTKKSG